MERVYVEKRPGEIGSLWRAPSRTRVGLSLVLGLFAGIALISIPALVSPTDQASNAYTVVGPQSWSLRDTLSAMPSNNSLTAGSTSDRLVLAFKLFLILIPGSVLSIMARRWASRRLEEYSYY